MEPEELHGRFAYSLSQSQKDISVDWLRNGSLFGETEGFMLAIQDQAITTRNHLKYIQKVNIPDDKCRLCHQVSETIAHITSGCTNLANTEYLFRHNQVCKIIHQLLAHKYKFIDSLVPYYKYEPQTVLESRSTRLYWDRPIVTDKTILANKPDITVFDLENKTAKIIDIKIPSDHNLFSSETEKIVKYNDLAIELKKIYNLKAIDIIPIVISCNGLLSKNFNKFISKLDLPPYIYKEIQKTVILDTCRFVRKVLNMTD